MSGADTHLAMCQCGQLRVTTVGDPDLVMACNCLVCQRRTGSPFGMGAYFRKEVARTAGEPRIYLRVADSGLDVAIRFCPECGTSVYWTADIRPEHVGVAVGCFGEPRSFEPARVIWCESKHPWVRFPDGVPEFPRGAPRPTAAPSGS